MEAFLDLTIYHNPRCSKSRQTLALIEEAGYTPKIIKYLEKPLTVEQVTDLIRALGFDDPRALMRKGETVYKDLDLKSETNSQLLIQAMVENPKLIERPIVVKGDKAILGRPPENVSRFL